MKKTQLYKLLQNDIFDIKPNSYGDLLFIDKNKKFPYILNCNVKSKEIKTVWELYSIIKYGKNIFYLCFKDSINSIYLICDNILYNVKISNLTNYNIIPIIATYVNGYNNVSIYKIKLKWPRPKSNKKIKEIENILKLEYINTL